jgi:acyl-CoA synthetase (AMP-forming)/AMP-acid ligase II
MFAACGLRREVFYPAYGLAEHTVSVTMGGTATLVLDKPALDAGQARPVEPGVAAADSTVEVVGCGRVKAGARVRIVDPETARPVPAGTVGEIWVDSPTKAAGYFGMPAETREVFEATVADGDPTRYLRTGDLGFFHDAELFVTGRAKDLIIFRGRNIYPQDLEESCRDAHPLIRPGGLAAFAIDTETETDGRLVMFLETRVKKLSEVAAEEIGRAVRRSLFTAHQLACHTVVVGRPGLVRKTTSRKVRRRACRQAFLDGDAALVDATIAVSTLGIAGSAAR